MPYARIEAAVRALFSGAARVGAAPLDTPLDALPPEERAYVERAIEKRQREFAAGRRVARRLIGSLGLPDAPLLPDADRVPRWPASLVGSISHTRDLCVVAIAARERIVALGVDAEIEDAVEPAVWERICTPRERAVLEALPPGERPLRATLCFSAKEALYKCVFPEARVYLGFQDVELEIDAQGGTFEATLRRASPPHGDVGQRLTGRWSRESGYVVTGLAVTRQSS